MPAPPDAAQAIYDRLWAEARESFLAGTVITDPHLLDHANDARRGLTLLIRPSPDVIARIMALLDEVSAIIPGQHVYAAESLHITVLSLISAAPDVSLDTIPVDAYRAVFEAVIPAIPPIEIEFTDLTASRDSLFVAGRSAGDALNDLRASLRGPLHVAALAERMEQRYRSLTAHVTILRFQTQPGPDRLRELVTFLESQRQSKQDPGASGTFTAREVEFVINDWYMSHDVVHTLGRYVLGGE